MIFLMHFLFPVSIKNRALLHTQAMEFWRYIYGNETGEKLITQTRKLGGYRALFKKENVVSSWERESRNNKRRNKKRRKTPSCPRYFKQQCDIVLPCLSPEKRLPPFSLPISYRSVASHRRRRCSRCRIGVWIARIVRSRCPVRVYIPLEPTRPGLKHLWRRQCSSLLFNRILISC